MSYKRVIGVDVSSKKLDISDSLNELPTVIDNTVDALGKFVKQLSDPQNTLVVCESSGGWENLMVDKLHEAAVNVAVVNPRQTHHYAKAHGYFEKSDKIDARLLRLFGEQIPVTLARPRTQREKEFQALTRRRVQVLTMINQEKNRKLLCEDALTCQLIDQILETLKKQLKSIDSAIKKFIEQLSKETPKVAILSSVPCVGPVTTATLCCELPELGEISRTKIAKLAGVAPMVKQSGESEGKRRARGGRSTVRRALYMSALVGTQSNPVIREFYLGLLKKGKPKKLALLACMRKLLLILHDMVRTQQSWDPARKANGQAVANLTTGSTCSASC